MTVDCEVYQDVMKCLHEWFSPPDFAVNLDRARENRLEDSGRWLRNGSEIALWKITPNSFLWLHGLSECLFTLGKNLIPIAQWDVEKQF